MIKMRRLYALAAITAHTLLSRVSTTVVNANRQLQGDELTGVVVGVEAVAGRNFQAGQDVSSLLVSEGTARSRENRANYVRFRTERNGEGDYQIHFVAPSAFTDASSVVSSLTVELSFAVKRRGGEKWLVDIFDYGTANDFVNIGNLGTAGTTWTIVSMTVPLEEDSTAVNYVDPTTETILMRISTTAETSGRGSSDKRGFLDFAQITATVAQPTIEAGDVLVDLVPCILAPTTVSEGTAGSYVMSQFFQGYWTPKTEIFIVDGTVNLTPLLVDISSSNPHGLCNAIFVGIVPSEAQTLALTEYSAQYQVRIVYFWESRTSLSQASKLGIDTYWGGALDGKKYVKLNAEGSTKVSITQPDLQTDLTISNLSGEPVRVVSEVAEREVLAEYLDSDGASIVVSEMPNAAILTYTGDDGEDEMHVFFPIAWFDAGSWAWAHYFHEWATKGVFMGERRFYLGAVVDDLFLATREFLYDGDDNEAPVASRCSGSDMDLLKAAQDRLNTQYPGSEIITEFAMNGAGILEKVGSTYVPQYEETPVTLKGTKWTEEGQSTVHDLNWLYDNLPTMKADFNSGSWTTSDDTLAKVLEYINTPGTFFHQSHTLIHLSRDQLRYSDCYTEDTANVQIALLTGMWESDNYNWRSMVSPGITGLFNEYCLETGALNLMTCYPGDNTFDGTVVGAAHLVNTDTPFHSIATTVDTNGFDGAQIVPRFATFVYFNCFSAACLVKENEYIRRVVCECSNLNPDEDKGTCASTVTACKEADDGISSFGTIEALFEAEATTTTRYLLAGRRDKYMFHQANIIPANDYGDGTQSLLEIWYELVMQAYSAWISFPVKSVKFDDLCSNFKQHEDLDKSGGYVTMTLKPDKSVSSMAYVDGSGAGLVPLTIPTVDAASYPTKWLPIDGDSETYGTDTTYYLHDADATPPVPATQPAITELPDIVVQE